MSDIPYTPIDTTTNIPIENLRRTTENIAIITDNDNYSAQIIDQNTYRIAALVVSGLSLSQAARSTNTRFSVAKQISNSQDYKIEILRLLSLAREEAAAGAIATKAGRLMELASMAEDIRTIRDRRAEACDIRNMPDDADWWNNRGIPYTEVAALDGLGENYDPASPINPALLPSSIRAAGAETGLLQRKFTTIRNGLLSQTVEEWSVDTSINKEIRDVHERVARELGQWSEKKEIEFTQKMYVGIAIEDI